MLPCLISIAAVILFAHTKTLASPFVSQLHSSPNTIPGAYRQATHTRSEDYAFPAREGWADITIRDILDLAHSEPHNLATRSFNLSYPDLSSYTRSHELTKSRHKRDKSLGGALGSVSDALKGIGDAISVVVTWYTGHDLENPSCWNKSVWTPTDESHACAVTLDGWSDKPKCLEFLELCLGKKCVFVRVVDTCAGCAPGSKHVDLTKAAFTALGSLDVGIMNVKMRKATTPKKWDTKLYGPKA